MTTFILVLYIFGYKSAAAEMQEFNSKAACEHAIMEIKKATGKIAPVLVCVPKSLEEI